MSQNQKKKRPLIEVIDLRVTARDIQLSLPFVEVTRLIIFQQFAGAQLRYDLYAGGASLTNGLQIEYNPAFEVQLFPEPIKKDSDYMKYGYDINQVVANAIVFQTARLSFFKMVEFGRGINVQDHPMRVRIQDDLSARGTELKWTFEGWTWDR